MTKQNKEIKQFFLVVLSFLMVFGNVTAANAIVNYDKDVAPLYVNISNHFEKLEISGIKATCSATQAMWNVTLSGGARTSTCTFIPAVTFVCPDSKSSIRLSLSSDYYLDSLDTFKEVVSVSRNVTCNPNSYSQS